MNPTDTASERAAEIAQHCDQARLNAASTVWAARCPAHDDRQASLSIGWDTTHIFLKCHAGCPTTDVVHTLGFRMSDLFLTPKAHANGTTTNPSHIVQAYDYTNEHGAVLYQTIRKEPKGFYQRQPHPSRPGDWLNTITNPKVERVLYRLPQVRAAIKDGHRIWVCEGEKDAESLAAIGLHATTAVGGASALWLASYNEVLRGVQVILTEDNDMAGRKRVQTVANALQGIAASVKVLTFHDLPPKSDVSDWIAAGGTRAQLEAIADATPEWTSGQFTEDTQHPPHGTTAQPPDAPEAFVPLPYSDYTNALTLVRDYGEDLRYCYPWRTWLVWNGRQWERDTSGKVMRLAKQTVKKLAIHAADLDDADAKALMKHVKESLSTGKLKAMIESAQSEPGIPVQPEDFDAHPWLLNVKNGTVDLRTGIHRAHNRADLLTKCLSYAYDEHATCPAWERFQWQVMGGTIDPDDPGFSAGELEARHQADERATRLIRFKQRFIGYSLTGSIREQTLVVYHGGGANGKSTEIETLQVLLDDYAQSTPSASLLAKDRHDGIPNDIARLRGARLVTAVEIGQGKHLNEELIKRLTGGDTITARFLHEEFFDFKAEFKLIIACNHLPTIKGTDHAIWRRVKLIPFGVTIAEPDQDKDLPTKLQAEMPGILRWAIQGCLDWQREGLGEPEEVKTATANYRASMDVFEGFLAEECYRLPGVQVKASELYEAYERWCKANDVDALNKKEMGIRLADSGFTPDKGTGGVRIWKGIGLPAKEDNTKRSGM